MNIVNPIAVNGAKQPIQSVLRILAGNGPDGFPYDQMVVAAGYIDRLDAELAAKDARIAELESELTVCRENVQMHWKEHEKSEAEITRLLGICERISIVRRKIQEALAAQEVEK